MQDMLYIENVDQAAALLTPIRIDLLKRLDVPRTCLELAEFFEASPQKIYYHVKALEKAGLVEKIEEHRVRGVVEGVYQAKARSYWLAPQLVKGIGGDQTARDQNSLRMLLGLAEEMQGDVGRLGQQSEAGKNIPSLSLSGQIYLPDGERRTEFLEEIGQIFTELARKYGLPPDEVDSDLVGKTFKLVLACYPKE